MAIDAVACSHCGGHASVTQHNLRHGWACPHCGQSHWPGPSGWTASDAGGRAEPVTSRIHPTRAATPGFSATLDLVAGPSLSPVARVAVIVGGGSAVALAMLVARTILG